jgi:hypothetical protein
MGHFLLTAAGVLIVLNVVASWRVWNDSLATRGQRIVQAMLIWILPLVGAFPVLSLNRATPSPIMRAADYPQEDNAFFSTDGRFGHKESGSPTAENDTHLGGDSGG